MKNKFLLIFFILSLQFTAITSIFENGFIIISGMQSDLDKRENLQITLDNMAETGVFNGTRNKRRS